jgi:hypothetical protein
MLQDDLYDREGLDTSLDEFNTYEDYLDSNIGELERFYLEDEELAR